VPAFLLLVEPFQNKTTERALLYEQVEFLGTHEFAWVKAASIVPYRGEAMPPRVHAATAASAAAAAATASAAATAATAAAAATAVAAASDALPAEEAAGEEAAGAPRAAAARRKYTGAVAEARQLLAEGFGLHRRNEEHSAPDLTLFESPSSRLRQAKAAKPSSAGCSGELGEESESVADADVDVDDEGDALLSSSSDEEEDDAAALSAVLLPALAQGKAVVKKRAGPARDEGARSGMLHRRALTFPKVFNPHSRTLT